jgi:hypothetical protein
MLMMHALSRTVVHELYRGELASVVGARCLQRPNSPSARAWMSLMVPDSLCGVVPPKMVLTIAKKETAT